MMKSQMIGTAAGVPARGGSIGDWQRWAPYAAVVWSLVYAAIGLAWAVSGQGFPYTREAASNSLGALVGRWGPGPAWAVVIIAGLPAAALGVAMLRGTRNRSLRPFFIAAGAVLAGILLLCMADLALLQMVGYIPYAIVGLVTGGEVGQIYLASLAQIKWLLGHQLLCILGGFAWLAGTILYARRSADACLYCGRADGPEGWQSPQQAARWGRIAVYVALVSPIFYALTRFAWALGIPLGMTEEYWRNGQEQGLWISGLFLAAFGLVGGVLMLGLVQRWGEVFPRWMIGLAGRRVPMALAIIPAALVAVLMLVAGISMWFGLPQMYAVLAATGAKGMDFIGPIVFQLGPVLVFPLWGVALAVATLGYYFRRRGACEVCGRGG